MKETDENFILRYAGDHLPLNDNLTQVGLTRVGKCVVYVVKCPFCHTVMDRSSFEETALCTRVTV